MFVEKAATNMCDRNVRPILSHTLYTGEVPRSKFQYTRITAEASRILQHACNGNKNSFAHQPTHHQTVDRALHMHESTMAATVFLCCHLFANMHTLFKAGPHSGR